MTDKQLDEKFIKTFENVHADLAVKARIRKELTGDKMNAKNITVNGETAQAVKPSKATVNHTGQIIAAAAALVIALGGGYYMKQRATNVNIDDTSSAAAAADLSSADSVITNSDLSFADSYTAESVITNSDLSFADSYTAESVITNSDLSFADSYTAAFLKKLDSRHFSAELELVYTETDNSDAVKNHITRIVEYNGHDTHGRVISYNGLGEPMTTDVYVNDDGTYNYLNGELQNKDTTPSYKNTDTDTDNTIIYKNFFNESIAPISPAAMTFKGIETTDTQIIEHFTYADGNITGYKGGKNSDRPEHEVSFTYDKETGDLIQFANSLAGEGTNTCIIKSFSEDVGELLAPDYGMSDHKVMTVIPDVTGIDPEAAEGKLHEAKLNVVVRKESSDTVEEGLVVRTEPAAGEMCPEGDTITVFVSKGHGDGKTAVPDVTGIDPEAAEGKLHEAKLNVVVRKESSDTVEEGLVVRTEPSGGAQVHEDDTVTIFVSKGHGDGKTAVPNVVGLNREEAVDRLKESGLTPVVEENYEHVGDNDKVIYMSADPDTLLDAGSEITIVVAVNDAEDLDVRVDLPEGLHGTYYITSYKDGKELSTTILDAEAFTGYDEKVSVSGTGTETFDIVITNKDTGKSVNYCKYTVDFNKKTATLNGSINKDGLLAITPAE